MTAAAWTKITATSIDGVDCYTATISSGTSGKSAVLKINPTARRTTIFIDIGATESAIQIKGSNKPGAVEADLIVLQGAAAIGADYDDFVEGGVTALQIVGATSANNTVIHITQVF